MTFKNDNLYYIVTAGTNVQFKNNNKPVLVDETYVDKYVAELNANTDIKYEKILMSNYNKKFSWANIIGTALDLKNNYFLRRLGTNERHVNFSNDINVCDKAHADKLLEYLNAHGRRWEAMSIETYYNRFGMIV